MTPHPTSTPHAAGFFTPRAILLGVLTVTLALTGCSNVKLKSDYDKDIDFKTYRTWAWSGTSDIQGNKYTRKRIVKAVEGEMDNKGYLAVSEDRADILVRVLTSASMGVAMTEAGYAYWSGWNWGYWGISGAQATAAYDKGTMVIDIVDASIDQLVFRSVAQGVMKSESPTGDEIRAFVGKMLAKFPPDK